MDDLERLRRLRDDAPAPDPGRRAEARDQLLALADEERRATERSHRDRRAAGGSKLAALRAGLAHRRRATLAAAAALVLLAGAAVVVAGALRGGDGSDCVELAASCRGPAGRYEVRYPAGWHTDAADGCTLFDDDPLGDAVGPVLGALAIQVTPASFDELAAPGETVTVVSSEEVTVDGRPAVRQVRASTGMGALPEGTRSYVYVVDLGEDALVASATESDDAPFERRRRLLDAMVASLELAGR